jgi:hypothetical protein
LDNRLEKLSILKVASARLPASSSAYMISCLNSEVYLNNK